MFTKKAKHFLVSLRFSILSIFVTLFVIAMGSLIVITYYRFSNSVSDVAIQLMQAKTAFVFETIYNEVEDVTIESELVSQLIESGVMSSNNLPGMMTYTYNVINTETKTLPSVQSAFWGDELGNFVISAKQPDGTVESNIINRFVTPATHIIIERDAKGSVIKHYLSSDMSYDPRLRPWYNPPKLSKKIIITDVYSYKFTRTPGLGFTVAAPVFDKNKKIIGVFGFNIRIDFLRHFIEKIKVSEHSLIFIVAEDGKVVAFPHLVQYMNPALIDIHQLKNLPLIASFDYYKKTKKDTFSFEYQGEKYLATYDDMPGFGTSTWLIGVLVPESDFIRELQKTNFITMALSLIILLIGIAIVSTLITRVVHPLKKLVKETEKIKRFELDDNKTVDSRIKEVMRLSQAIRSMKKGLRSFQKYVPATLVRQLIEAGEDVAIGGTKKNIVILFTDIKNFSTIAETMDPDELMEYLCEYFNVLAEIISATGGTVDKYIGDSVMAFWGAPVAQDNSSYHAARAALLAKKQLDSLNIKWQQEEKPQLFTRFGIHEGEAVIGNVGSKERLNYTAIGDVINVTKRLEEINKNYNTQIIVSESVYQNIKDKFTLRLLDSVTLKGRKTAINIYELIDEM